MVVGDPKRPLIGSAIFATLQAAIAFSVLTGPVKQIALLYRHAPWTNDPFDTIISFALFFVPLIAVCCLMRVSLCQRSTPLPVARVRDLLRGCRVVLLAIGLTLLSEWIALGIGGNRAQWDGVTWLQVGFLASMSILAARAAVALRRASAATLSESAGPHPDPDWLTDMVIIAQRQSRWLGPLRRPALRMVSWLERRVLTVVRRHPLWTSVLACGTFGVLVGVNQGIAEGYDFASMLTVVILLGGGMFALLVGAGSYLGLVRSSGPRLHGIRRRVVDASVLTCGGVLVPFAFRYHLWWIVGGQNATAGIPQLAALLGIFALSIFFAVLALESLLHSYANATR